MRRTRKFLFVFATLFLATPAIADGIGVRMGPPASGQGGPNPITFSPIELGISYVTDSFYETNLSITGLFFGKRQQYTWGGYVSGGGGLAISANGAGPGAFTAFGADLFCGWVCLSMEYTQGIGFGGSDLVSPYGVRLGVFTWF